MKKNIKWLLLVSLSFVACNNNDDETVTELPVTPGFANFAKYVALGDSFAAGYSDGALFKKGQENSYPNILAGQFAQVGGGAFNTPFMADNVGGFAGSSVYTPRLYFNGSGPASVAMPPYNQVATTSQSAHLSGSFNNMGIPGAKSFHLLAAGYGSSAGNPYFARFASAPMATVIADAVAQNPTFFSLWIGGNDVLGYATTGGDGTNPITPTTGAPGVGFDGTYNALASQLATGGRKGVVANLPYVNTLPFFTTVGYNPVPLVAAQVSALNSGYAAYNGGLVAAKNLGYITEAERLQRTINFTVGKNAVVIIDEYLTDITPVNAGLIKMRQATSADYVLLSSQGVSAQSYLAAGNGTAAPLQDRWVLSKNEIAELKTATDAYNATIEAAANTNGLAFVDAKSVMNQLVNGGIRFGNYHMTAQYVTGGAFSLDGVHPSARGYALIANKFLEAINAKYGSTFKPVDLGTYPIQYPASF